MKYLVPLLLVAVMLGCTNVGPDYRAPQLDLPVGWQSTAAGVVIAPAPADPAWWRQLAAPLLSALIEDAMAASPDLEAARASLREARARTRIAAAGRAPELDAAATASRHAATGSSAGNLFNLSLDASWEIDLFGGARRAIEAARADYAAVAAGLADARVSIAAEVALNYVALLTAQERLALARASLASQSETLQLTDWRVRAGLASSVDLQQAISNREQTAARIPVLETQRSQAGYALAVLLGSTPGALHARLAAADGLPAIPPGIALGIPAETLRQRPDVRAAEARLAAETARTGVAIANRYPAFRLSGSIGIEALTLGGVLSGDTVSRSLATAVTGPLFDGGRLRAQVDAQQAVQDRALANYRASVLEALLEVENALSDLDSGRRREETLLRAADAARHAAELARQRYRAGLIDFQTVLDTERTRLAVEDSLATARSDRLSALVRLYKALGGGWSGEPPSGPPS